ncbi:MAG: menaquinone biosynthesis protein [Bacillota bacterium]
MKLRLGQVDYLNCLPVYYAIEKKLVPVDIPLKVTKGVPTHLNRLFFEGKLDVTPLSSIEYTRHPEEHFILPNISISSDGCVGSVLLFSRVPVTELDGCRVAVTASSATSVVLLRILFEHYYNVNATFLTRQSNLDAMLTEAEAVLLIGDEALRAAQRIKERAIPLKITDLGEVWKEFTGEKMICALWVARGDFVRKHPEETSVLASILLNAKEVGMGRVDELVRVARRTSKLPEPVLREYFGLIKYGFDESYRRALLLFYDYAYKSGLIEERVNSLNVWGEHVG